MDTSPTPEQSVRLNLEISRDGDQHVEAEPLRQQSEPLVTRRVADHVISSLLLEDES